MYEDSLCKAANLAWNLGWKLQYNAPVALWRECVIHVLKRSFNEWVAIIKLHPYHKASAFGASVFEAVSNLKELVRQELLESLDSLEDLTKPPRGYSVSQVSGDFLPPPYPWFFTINMRRPADIKYFDTEEEAIAGTWAHYRGCR